MKVWPPVQKSGGSRVAPLLSCRETCWLLQRNKGKSVTELCRAEESSWKAGYKGEWRANTFTSCCTLAVVISQFAFCVCNGGSCRWAEPSTPTQDNPRAIRKPPCLLPPPMPHLGPFSYWVSECQTLHEDWLIQKERPEGCSNLTDTFSAGSVISPDSQPSVGCKVSVLSIEFQNASLSSHVSYWPSERCLGLSCLIWRKDATKSEGACFPVNGGSAWSGLSGLELRWNRMALLNLRSTWLPWVYQCLGRPLMMEEEDPWN